jgi:hypothetical protein
LKAYISVTDAVPPVVVAVNAVPVLVVLEVPVLIDVTPVCVVVCPTEEVTRLVDVLVRIDVEVFVVVPAVGPVTVLVVAVVPVTSGLLVITGRVVEAVAVGNVEVVLAELVEEVELVDETDVVVVTTTSLLIVNGEETDQGDSKLLMSCETAITQICCCPMIEFRVSHSTLHPSAPFVSVPME